MRSEWKKTLFDLDFKNITQAPCQNQHGNKYGDKGTHMNAIGRVQVSKDEELDYGGRNQREAVAEFTDGVNVGRLRGVKDGSKFLPLVSRRMKWYLLK